TASLIVVTRKTWMAGTSPAMTARRRSAVKRSAWTICAALFVLAAVPAHAQSYPTRAVTIVVPFAPGGGTDLLARLTAQRLEGRLGKPFVIENRPGAGTIIAAMAAVRAAP